MAAPPTAQFANAPLPEDQLVPGWRVGLILSSFSVSLPGFLNGAQTGLALGLHSAALAGLLAGLLLCVGGCLTGIVSVRARMTTYLLVQRSFGRRGAMLVNLVIAAVHYGWFGVNVSFFGSAMDAAMEQIYGVQGHFVAFVIGGSVLMSVSTIFGFHTLEKLSLVAVPLLGFILVAVCVAAVHRHGIVLAPNAHPPEPMSFGVALSALIGGNMLTIAAMPDISRYIRTARGTVAGMLISFPFAIPVVILIAAMPALAMNQTDITTLIVGFGFGVPALAMLVLSSWTLNSANLYSASLSLSATFPGVPSWIFILAGGGVGCGFALMGIMDDFVPFLLFLRLIIPPIAAIYVIDGFVIWRHADSAATLATLPAVRWPAILTWVVSVSLMLIARKLQLSLTTVPTLDATLLAAAIYGTLLKLRRPAGVTTPR